MICITRCTIAFWPVKGRMSGSGAWVTSPFGMLIIFKLENQSGSGGKYACNVVT